MCTKCTYRFLKFQVLFKKDGLPGETDTSALLVCISENPGRNDLAVRVEHRLQVVLLDGVGQVSYVQVGRILLRLTGHLRLMNNVYRVLSTGAFKTKQALLFIITQHYPYPNPGSIQKFCVQCVFLEFRTLPYSSIQPTLGLPTYDFSEKYLEIET